jgi:hypothetical protein
MDRIGKHIPISKRFKLGVDQDVVVNIGLENNVKELIEFDINKVINSNDVFENERVISQKYRFSGKLSILTANELSPSAKSSDWDPLFDGNPPTTPNNWLLQLTYPSRHSYDYPITLSYTTNHPTKANEGPIFFSVLGENVGGNTLRVAFHTQFDHKLLVGDYVYIYKSNKLHPHVGIYEVIHKGFDTTTQSYFFVIDKEYFGGDEPGNFKRVLNVSDSDKNFSNPITISNSYPSNLMGNTNTPIKNYTKIKTLETHTFVVGDFIDIRHDGIFNGIFEIVYIIDNNNFVINHKTNSTQNYTNKPLVNRVDCIPSEYYVRYFKVLTTNNYEIYNAGFSQNIYPNSGLKNYGLVNDNWLYHFINGIDFSSYKDNKNGIISEVYLTTIKRAGKNTYNWSNVTSHWEPNKILANTTNNIELISKHNTTGVGSVEKNNIGDEYVGDYVEYNKLELKEKTIMGVVHRFGNNTNPDSEGYYYKPFKKLKLRVYSENIETADVDELIIGVPDNYETYKDGSIAWRDLLDIGFFEPDNPDRVDYPFVNGYHYYYTDHTIYVRRQRPVVDININELITTNPINIC